MTRAPRFEGKLVLRSEMRVVTGLRIGAATSALEIGGIDNAVVRDAVTGMPYVPGSSLKGKLRSLLTRAHGLALRRSRQVQLHWCVEASEYRECVVCPTFGQAPVGEYAKFVTPTRLAVRDAFIAREVEVEDGGGVRRVGWEDVETDLPYTEVKTEVALDVVTAASNPRQMERVPPGAIFNTELLFTVYRPDGDGIDAEMEKKRLREVVVAMRLLEDDYLGSSGTRGYGKVKFQRVKVLWRPLNHYRDPAKHPEETLWEGDDLPQLLAAYDEQVARKVWGTA